MFGQDVTPNQHRLAEQFILLDNFYATGGNSADGHQWLTQANEVDYCLWPGMRGAVILSTEATPSPTPTADFSGIWQSRRSRACKSTENTPDGHQSGEFSGSSC